MRPVLAALLTVGIFSLAASPCLAQKKGKFNDEAPRFGWRESLSEAMTEAKRTGKPVMVVFRCIP